MSAEDTWVFLFLMTLTLFTCLFIVSPTQIGLLGNAGNS